MTKTKKKEQSNDVAKPYCAINGRRAVASLQIKAPGPVRFLGPRFRLWASVDLEVGCVGPRLGQPRQNQEQMAHAYSS